MTNFKVGDKVRILNVDAIALGHRYWKNGDVTEVVSILFGNPQLKRTVGDEHGASGDRLHIDVGEFHAIELVKEDVNMAKQYRTEKRKARKGERILITYAGPINEQDYAEGDVFTVTETDVISRGDVHVSGLETYIDYYEYEVIVEKTATTTLETRVTELEAEVEALKAQLAVSEPKPKQVVAKKTPNQRRADVIERARAFVADLEGRAISDTSNRDGNTLFNHRTTRLTFHVNAEKGVVTALAHGKHGGELFDKAFARCAPGDVFNADIGKAIAAGRLYGVEVPADFLDAPKPTEFAKGQFVYGTIPQRKYTITEIDGDKALTRPGTFYRLDRDFKTVNVLDDTDAVYV